MNPAPYITLSTNNSEPNVIVFLHAIESVLQEGDTLHIATVLGRSITVDGGGGIAEMLQAIDDARAS